MKLHQVTGAAFLLLKAEIMKYNFDEIIDRKNTNCIKWDGSEIIKMAGITERFDDDSIPLFIADMDFTCPQPVLEAMHKTVEQRIFGYTSHQLSDDYYSAIISWFKRRHNWIISKEHIVYSPGTVHALDVAVRTFSQPGNGIIIQRPVYAPFTQVIEQNNRKVINNELINDNNYYRIDFDDLEKKASNPDNTMMILCSPHNPAGRIWTKEELREIGKICYRNNVLLISDEIHGDLIRGGENFHPIANLLEHDNYIICTAINKTFNLAGLHCSNIVIPNDDLRNQYNLVMGIQSPTPFAIAALIAAYNEGEEWLEQLKAYLDQNFIRTKGYITKHLPKVRFRIPEGTYIAWFDFSDYGLSDVEIHNRIYNTANVILEDGKIFGEKSDKFQRICLPEPWAVIETALDRIAKQF